MNNSNSVILDQIVVVNLEVHIWTARRKLTPPDLAGALLPPEELASLGSKRVCDPEKLRIFETLKARAVNVLAKTGVRFLGGWAIPENKIDEVSQELSTIRDDFNNAKDNFLQDYEGYVRDWIDRHPDWKEIIANSVVGENYVRSRLDFRWQTFRIIQPESAPSSNLGEDLDNLGMTLFEEISKTAKETWRRCYAGKTEITRKALSPLKSIYDKLAGLTFMEPRVAPVVELLDAAFKSLPKRGLLKNGALIMLQGLVALLSSPAALLEHGQMILEGRQGAREVLDGFLNDPFVSTLLSTQGVKADPSNENENLPESEFTDSLIIPVIESQGLW